MLCIKVFLFVIGALPQNNFSAPLLACNRTGVDSPRTDYARSAFRLGSVRYFSETFPKLCKPISAYISSCSAVFSCLGELDLRNSFTRGFKSDVGHRLFGWHSDNFISTKLYLGLPPFYQFGQRILIGQVFWYPK